MVENLDGSVGTSVISFHVWASWLSQFDLSIDLSTTSLSDFSWRSVPPAIEFINTAGGFQHRHRMCGSGNMILFFNQPAGWNKKTKSCMTSFTLLSPQIYNAAVWECLCCFSIEWSHSKGLFTLVWWLAFFYTGRMPVTTRAHRKHFVFYVFCSHCNTTCRHGAVNCDEMETLCILSQHTGTCITLPPWHPLKHSLWTGPRTAQITIWK